MNSDALVCGESLATTLYQELCQRAVFECFEWNLNDHGHSKLAAFPLILSRALFQQLSSWAVALDAEAQHAECELLNRPDLYGKLGLPLPLRYALRRASMSDTCRYARYDFHPLAAGGFAITEGNVDVASGFNAASGVANLFAPYVPGAKVEGDPAAAIAQSLLKAVGPQANVGCLYLTNFVDDHQVVRFVAKYLAQVGLRPVLFGPSQLRWKGNQALALIGSDCVPLDAVFRFFPADWLPRLGLKSRWWRVLETGGTRWMNPASSLLTQTKRFPLVWPQLHSTLPSWKRLLPETKDPKTASGQDWVFKPALAHEGYKVGISGVTQPSAYAEIVEAAQRSPAHWVAQRRFEAAAIATPDGLRFPCLGVYVIDGRFAGLYGRLSPHPLIDGEAQNVVLLVQREP